MNTKNNSTISGALILAALIGAGLWLFWARAHATENIAYEARVYAQASKRLIVNDQYVILTKKAGLDLKAILEPLNLEVTMPLLNWTLVSKKGLSSYKELSLSEPEAEDDKLVLRSLLENPLIIAAEHNFVLEGALVPSNINFAEEWPLSAMDLPSAWNVSTGSKAISVAVIDDFLLEDRFIFAERFALCADRVSLKIPAKNLLRPAKHGRLPHGELMLLALGACNNVKEYSAGIDWQSELLAIERGLRGHAQSFLAALYASGIDVCQESLTPCTKTMAFESQLSKKANVVLMPQSTNAPELLHFVSDMIAAISQKNVTLVTPSGNNGQRAKDFLPGGAPGVINVGALKPNGKRAPFSNWGPSIDLLAPGDKIKFYYPSGIKKAQGTSIAAAYTAGSVALMNAVNLELSPKAAHYFLKQSANSLKIEDYCLGESACSKLCEKNGYCGNRTLNTYEALRLAKEGYIDAPVITLDRHFVLFYRSHVNAEHLMVYNIGDKAGEVRAVVYDDNLLVTPAVFSLSERSGPNYGQELLLSFKREPFARRTIKIELIAYDQGHAVDKTELYVEYVPKK